MKRWLAMALLVIGSGSVMHGLWIPAKAALAQILLRQAWQRTLAGHAGAKPWPWADTRPVARMRIDRNGADFIVLEGANGRALAFAPAHLEHTALPGRSGNCVISGHRDTHFAAVRDVRPGDVVRLQQMDGRWTTYRIGESRVVDASDTFVAAPTAEAALTLITCWPFDAITSGGRERYVIRAWRDP